MGVENRNLGRALFKPGDIDLAVLKKYLTLGRRIDNVVLNKLNISKDRIDTISEEEAVAVFNALLSQHTLHQYIDIGELKLSNKTMSLFSIAHEAAAYGKSPAEDVTLELNHTLLHAVYIQNSVQVRKYDRFASAALLKTTVSLTPIKPFIGEKMHAILSNISAGGMALLLKERIPPQTKLALEAEFMDRTQVKTEVLIKHVIKGGDLHIHGFEFSVLPDFQRTKFTRMSHDHVACETRIHAHEKDVCHLDCSLYNICLKSEKR